MTIEELKKKEEEAAQRLREADRALHAYEAQSNQDPNMRSALAQRLLRLTDEWNEARQKWLEAEGNQS